MHSDKEKKEPCLCRTASMHTVVTVRHSAALSLERFSLRRIHTTPKGVSRTNRKHRNCKGKGEGGEGRGVVSQYHH